MQEIVTDVFGFVNGTTGLCPAYVVYILNDHANLFLEFGHCSAKLSVCVCRQLGISELRYDSVEAMHPHSYTPIYITYNSGHGYPKYLITYTA